MPIRDPEKRRLYNREYARMRRSGAGKTPGQTVKPEDIATARTLLKLLFEQLAIVRKYPSDVLVKARCIGFLVGVGLRAVETAELERRLNVLEDRILQGGGDNGHKRQN